MANERIAILVGAGASFGAWDGAPPRPPLGVDLFPALCGSFPATWGRLTEDQKALFVAIRPGIDFEHGMQRLWEDEMSGKESATWVQDLIVDMAVYFARFRLPDGRGNRYTELIACLQRHGLTWARLGVASLNYECLLEMAIAALGVTVDSAPVPPRADAISVWKPHGACNLVLRDVANGKWGKITVRRSPNMAVGDLPLVALTPPEVETIYQSRRTIPPAMSLYAPGKHSPVVPRFIDQSRAQWVRWTSNAQLALSIGTRYVRGDHHVWKGIARGEGTVWYIGDENSAMKLRRDVGDRRLVYPGERLGEALPDLITRLESFA